MKPIIRIATRKSPLALWQAQFVKQQLLQIHPELQVELISMLTTADKFLSTPLAKIGGKGLFVKELESALLEQRADIAVHSIKDIPVEFPQGLTLAVICKREDPRDVLISNNYKSLADLPQNATIGTSSLRRQCQLLAMRPDLQITPLRGNVNSRLQKLDGGNFSAIVLAAAGMKRLGEQQRIREFFAPEKFIPAIGQGAIGIECREDDIATRNLIDSLDHQPTRNCVTAERAMNQHFGGNCQIPIAAHAVLLKDQVRLVGLIGKTDGSKVLRSEKTSSVDAATNLGKAVAADLLKQGAAKILQELKHKS